MAELARRINGKYLQPQAQHLLDRVKEIESGKCEKAIQKMMKEPLDKIKELYNTRDIEK